MPQFIIHCGEETAERNNYKMRFLFNHQNVEHSFSWIIILLLGFRSGAAIVFTQDT